MSSGLEKVEKIYKCIEDIEFILNTHEIKVTKAIENKTIKQLLKNK